MFGSSSTTRMRAGGASTVTPAGPRSCRSRAHATLPIGPLIPIAPCPRWRSAAVLEPAARRPRPTGPWRAAARRHAAGAAHDAAQAPPRHQAERLDHDERGHLRLAGLAVDEADRHLGDGGAVLASPGRSSRSGSRSPRPGCGRGRAGARCRPSSPVPRRRVGHAETEHRRRVAVAAARQQMAVPGPVRDGAALDVRASRSRRRSPRRAAPPTSATRRGRARSRRRSRCRRRSRARGPRRSRPGRRCRARTSTRATAGARRAARPPPPSRGRPCRRDCRRRPPARPHPEGTRGSGAASARCSPTRCRSG